MEQGSMRLLGDCRLLSSLCPPLYSEWASCSCHFHPGKSAPTALHTRHNITGWFSNFRWLVNQGRDDEALAVLSRARNLPPDADLVQIEYLCVPPFLRFILVEPRSHTGP